MQWVRDNNGTVTMNGLWQQWENSKQSFSGARIWGKPQSIYWCYYNKGEKPNYLLSSSYFSTTSSVRKTLGL
jgi:hypothetical protein